VIGTLAKRGAEQGMRVLISTGDKDMAQLVEGDQVTLINTMTDTRLNREGVKEKFDVWPEQIIDYLALVGDSSDNIPGVPGVGPKTAAPLLAHFGTLEALYERIGEVPQVQVRGAKTLGPKLAEHKESAFLSKRLATIHCAVELPLGPRDLAMRTPDKAKLKALYSRFGFKTWGRQLDEGGDEAHASKAAPAAMPAAARPAVPAKAGEYTAILDQKSFDAWVKGLEAAELIAYDSETTSLEYMKAEIVGMSFAVKSGEAVYIPLAHRYMDAPVQLDRDQVLKRLKPLLEDPKRLKLGHHIKYDAHVLLNYGIKLAGMRYDSMLESYVLDSVASRHDMDSLAEKYLDYKTIHYEDVAGKGAKQIGFDQVHVDEATRYAAEDADVTLRLHQALWPRLRSVPALKKVFDEIEMPLVPVLLRMEHEGVLIDVEMLKKQSDEITKKCAELQTKAQSLAGGPFNLDSPKQLQAILFEKMEIPVVRKTASGQPSTAEDVLEELAGEHELPKVILEYRSLNKLKSTYTDKLPEQINERSGRIHTSYQQTVAATGRLSSSDPNLQNIPIRTAEGRRIRQAFIAHEGYSLVAADYSQIELRIMAHLSSDASLLKAFAEDRDIHQATAAEVLRLPVGEVSADQRRSAKAVNFGLIYGMSAFGLARQLGIPRGDAQRYVDLYFERYPGVKRYMNDTRAQAREMGYVETVFGRRLYLPEIRSRNAALRQYAERSAINAPMQGTAADIIKRAMIEVDAWLEKSQVPARLIMQVHDELVLEVADAAVEDTAARLREHMIAAAELAVPLKVDVGIGLNWDEAH
jgi:DNA polymerase-1